MTAAMASSRVANVATAMPRARGEGHELQLGRIVTPSVPSLPQRRPERSTSSGVVPLGASIWFRTRSSPYPALRRIVLGKRSRISFA